MAPPDQERSARSITDLAEQENVTVAYICRLLPLKGAHGAARELFKIGDRIVRYGCYAVFQMAEVAVPPSLFADILRRIDDLRPKPPPVPA